MKKTVMAVPTKSGNGFTAGRVYKFTHVRNAAYETCDDNGNRKVECYPFDLYSPHLWDGYGHFNLVAGRFEEVRENRHET